MENASGNHAGDDDVRAADHTMLAIGRRLWRLLKESLFPFRWALFGAWLLALVIAAAAFSGPFFIAHLLDEAIPNRDVRLFEEYSLAILASLGVFFLASATRSYILCLATERIFLDLRKRLVAAILRKPEPFFARHESGDLVTRVSTDTDAIALIIFDFGYASLNGITLIIIFAILMVHWEWRFALYAALALPGYLFLVSLFQKPLARASSRARERLSEQNETLLDMLAGVSEIRFYQQSRDEERRFGRAAAEFTSANIRSLLIGQLAFDAMETLARLFATFPFILAGWWLCHGSSTLSIGTLVAYNLYMTYIATVIEVINVGVYKFSQASPMIHRLQVLLDSPAEPAGEQSESTDAVPQSTRIEFRALTFSRHENQPVLRDFDLVIEPGEKVALMGPSGSGKSTLLELLTRRIVPDRGEIRLGDRPIVNLALPVYLQNFSYVRQKPHIFRATVRENIAFGWYHIPMDVVIDAAQRAKIHDAIIRLPDGYETVLGAGGAGMSGGQMQRLALARALVRDPAILLLDEFTSALDRATEDGILEDLFRLFARQTIICATHSHAVAERFARMVSMEKV